MISKENRIHFEKIDSTNDFLLHNHFPHGTIVTASTQTKGKGRNHRKWFDVPNQTFIFSMVLYSSNLFSYFSLLVSLCIVEAVKEIQKEFSQNHNSIWIKWPNDILLHKHNRIGKLAGILVETIWKEDIWQIVIGIGLNWKSFPAISTQKFSPISLWEADFPEKPDYFLDYLIKKFNEFSLENPYPFSTYQELIHQYHYLYQKKIRIQNQIYSIGRIDSNGFLTIEDPKKQIQFTLQDWNEEYQIL